MKQTVFVVDDEAEVRDAISWLFSTMDVEVRCFASAEEFLEAYHGELGCLILDVRMKGMSGLKLQEKITDEKIDIPIIFITGHGDVPMAVHAMKLGAVEFLTKPFNNQQLLDIVHSSLEKNLEKYIKRQAKQAVLDRVDSLTAREREVLASIVTGKMNKVIAADLGISPHTVELHRAKIMKKMQVRTIGELINIILSNNINTELADAS